MLKNVQKSWKQKFTVLTVCGFFSTLLTAASVGYVNSTRCTIPCKILFSVANGELSCISETKLADNVV